MGYGLRALELLTEYYLGHTPSLEEAEAATPGAAGADETGAEEAARERLEPRKRLPPLLLRLSEKRPERLDYLGVSYGLTADLLRSDALLNLFFFEDAGF